MEEEMARIRMFPSYTTAELYKILNGTRPVEPVTREKIEAEIAAREAGLSKPKVTPQLPPPGAKP